MTKILQGSRILLAFVAITLLASGSSLYAKKPPSDPEPDPPPVNYVLQRGIMPADHNGSQPNSRNINDEGEIVGYYDSSDGGVTPYYYDINSEESELTNLNDMTLILDPGYDDVPDGWYIYRAFDINNLGDICGALALKTDPEQQRGFVLELRPDNGVLPRLHLIPDEAYWPYTYASRINDAGEVLGRGSATDSYIWLQGDGSVTPLPFIFSAQSAYLNNFSQVLTSGGLLFTLGDEENFVDLGIDATYRGINDLGLICGSRQVAAKGNKTNDVGYIYDILNEGFTDLSSLSSAVDLNSNADVIGYKTIRKNIFVGDNTRPTLVHADEDVGVIDLDSEGVVVFDNTADQTAWENASIRTPLLVSERNMEGTDPAVAEFPVIVGRMTHPDTYFYYTEMYIMRPVPVIQP